MEVLSVRGAHARHGGSCHSGPNAVGWCDVMAVCRGSLLKREAHVVGRKRDGVEMRRPNRREELEGGASASSATGLTRWMLAGRVEEERNAEEGEGDGAR
jgi:hypothetical protein